MMKMELTQWQLNDHDQQLVDLSLKEDLGKPFCDFTTEILFPEHHELAHKSTAALAHQDQFQARIISKHPLPITLCGLLVVSAIIKKFNQQCVVHSNYHDGNHWQHIPIHSSSN